MKLLKHLLFSALFLLPLSAGAGELVPGEDLPVADSSRSTQLSLTGYGLYDLHLATGSVGGGALILNVAPNNNYSVDFGAEVVSNERYSLLLSGNALLWGNSSKKLLLENRYLYRQYASLNIQEFTAALLLRWTASRCDLTFGLCNRYYAELVQRSNGGMGTILEPMNVMFSAEGWLWAKGSERSKTWNVGLRWSNYNDFVIERVSNWMYSIKGYYRLPKNTYFFAEAGIHPAGSLNLTSSYDGWYLHLGAQQSLGERSKR